MATRKRNDGIPRLYIKKGDSLKTIYAKARRAFTAEDLVKYATEEETIPFEKVLAELEAIQAEPVRKPKAKRKKRV